MFTLSLFAATVNFGLVALIAGLAALAGIGVVSWAFRRDDKWEEFSKDCAKAAGFFRKIGFDILAEALECLAAKDWSGLRKAIGNFRTVIDTTEKAREHMKKVTLVSVKDLMDDDMDFVEKVTKIVTSKKYVEEAERRAEREMEEAELLLKKQRLDQEIERRQAEKAKQGTPATV